MSRFSYEGGEAGGGIDSAAVSTIELSEVVMDQELKQYFDAKFAETNGQIDDRIAESEARTAAKLVESEARTAAKFVESEARLVEVMRDMQTELLRGFAAFSEPIMLRLRKMEVDHSTQDVTLSGRMEVLERRLLQIEQRLGDLPLGLGGK